MSDLTINDRYSFDNMSAGRLPTTNVTLPKSQPVRLKELLHSCGSDEDDDDDDESEEKPRQSEDELDFDEVLLQNDSGENTLQEPLVCRSNINSSSIESMDEVSKTTCILPKDTHEVVTNTSSVQREINFATNKEKCKVSDVSDPNKLEISSKQEEKTQEYHNGTFPLRSQVDTVHNRSTNIALPPPSLSVYKGEYNAKFDANKNLQPINSNQVYHENAYMSDKLNKKKEGSIYSTSMENKILLTRNSELNLSKDDQRYKGTYSSIEQANKDCEEESHKIPNSLSESGICTSQTSENLIHPARYSLQKNITKYEVMNEKYTPAKNTMCTEFSTPSLNEGNKSIIVINRLASKTPLKHVQHGVHPSPCTSQKQLFQTPQNKLSGDLKNHVQTPSTILSSWYNNTVRPMESKNFIARDHVQMPRNAIHTPIIEKPDSSRFVWSIKLSYNYTLEVNSI